jgi:hypothetical protein
MVSDSISVQFSSFSFNFVNLFFKIECTIHQLISVADFGLKVKSNKTFDVIMTTKSVFLKFRFWGVWGAAARQPPIGRAPVPISNKQTQMTRPKHGSFMEASVLYKTG